jgi:hypothetical protein
MLPLIVYVPWHFNRCVCYSAVISSPSEQKALRIHLVTFERILTYNYDVRYVTLGVNNNTIQNSRWLQQIFSDFHRKLNDGLVFQKCLSCDFGG